LHHLDHGKAAGRRIPGEKNAGVFGIDHALDQDVAGADREAVARRPCGFEGCLNASDRGFQSVTADIDHRLEHAGEAVARTVLGAARTSDRKSRVAEPPPDPAKLTLAG